MRKNLTLRKIMVVHKGVDGSAKKGNNEARYKGLYKLIFI